MKTVWHIKGEKAGSFESVSDAKASKLVGDGVAQICDGETVLEFPENHPDYKPKRGRPRKTVKPKYPDKMMRA
jgi:hypothetical protein